MPAVGFFFALTVAPSIVENDISRSGANASYAPLEMLIVTTFFTVLFSVVMFGLAFLKDKAVESGYWVFGGAYLCLFYLRRYLWGFLISLVLSTKKEMLENK